MKKNVILDTMMNDDWPWTNTNRSVDTADPKKLIKKTNLRPFRSIIRVVRKRPGISATPMMTKKRHGWRLVIPLATISLRIQFIRP